MRGGAGARDTLPPGAPGYGIGALWIRDAGRVRCWLLVRCGEGGRGKKDSEKACKAEQLFESHQDNDTSKWSSEESTDLGRALWYSFSGLRRVTRVRACGLACKAGRKDHSRASNVRLKRMRACRGASQKRMSGGIEYVKCGADEGGMFYPEWARPAKLFRVQSWSAGRLCDAR